MKIGLPHYKTFQMGGGVPSISIPDAKDAQEFVRCTDGKVAVVMHRESTTYGNLILPEYVATQMRADLGVVVSTGVEGVKAGDTVLCRYGQGLQVRGFSTGLWDAPGEMRFFGYAGGRSRKFDVPCDPTHDAVPVPWWTGIMAIYGAEIKATGDNVILRLMPLEEEVNGIVTANPSRPPFGTVVSAGPLCKDVHEGDTVVYHEGATVWGQLGEDDLAIIPEESIYAVIE